MTAPAFDSAAAAASILSIGTPRSEPYRFGLCRILEAHHRQATGKPPLPPLAQCLPYLVGSAEADAFFAGCDRGHFEWQHLFSKTYHNQPEIAPLRKECDQ